MSRQIDHVIDACPQGQVFLFPSVREGLPYQCSVGLVPDSDHVAAAQTTELTRRNGGARVAEERLGKYGPVCSLYLVDCLKLAFI